MPRRPSRWWPSRPPAAPLMVPLALALLSGGPSHAQSSGGDILSPRPVQRPAPLRPAQSDILKPTIDGRERPDVSEPQLRPAARDGDVTPVAEPPLRDGIIDLTEPEEIGPEGIDTSRVDARPPTDSGVFEWPPAGYNPQLFQTEDIEPLRDRRLETFFRSEPYQAIGYRIGSFVLFPELELAGVAFSNVLRNPQPKRDTALEAKPELRLVSNWRWHALELKANGRFSFHDEFTSEDDRNSLLEARGRLDITKRTNLQGLVSQQTTQESRSGINATSAGQRADVTTTQAAASLNHRFNRLHVQLRGGVTEAQYGTVQDELTGATVESRERNLVQTDEAVRVRYDLKSAVGVFAETGLVQRSYEAAPADGLKRDSQGERVRVGLVFLPEHRHLRGEASLGWGRQSPSDQGLATVDGLLIDANLVWRMTPLTSLLFTARSDITDSVNDFTSGVVTRTAGLEGRHVLRQYLTATAGLQLTRNRYVGSALEEKETSARLGLEYAFSRELQVFTRYEHIWLDTTAESGKWQADEIRLGMRIRH